jgi:hypothetical protein
MTVDMTQQRSMIITLDMTELSTMKRMTGKKNYEANEYADRATYSIDEAPDVRGISRTAAFQAAHRGEIPFVRFGVGSNNSIDLKVGTG